MALESAYEFLESSRGFFSITALEINQAQVTGVPNKASLWSWGRCYSTGRCRMGPETGSGSDAGDENRNGDSYEGAQQQSLHESRRTSVILFLPQ